MIFAYIFLFINLVYCVGVLYLWNAWKSQTEFSNDDANEGVISVTVILPVRNEQQHIESCLNSLIQQAYPKSKFEILVINDHSEDATCEKVAAIQTKHSNVYLYDLPSAIFGKKAAIHDGISKAKGDFILTIDGDCEAGLDWIRTMVNYYLRNKACKMIFGPVSLMNGDSLFNRVQMLEFAGLTGAGGAAALLEKPFVCNGANMGYAKSIYTLLNPYFQDNLASGDDVFMLLRTKEEFGPASIKFVNSIDALVTTKDQNSVVDFMNQRIRWASKSKMYKDKDAIAISVLVFAANLSLLLLLIMSLFSIKFVLFALLAFSLKTLSDLIFLKEVLRFYRKGKLLKMVIPLQFFYIIYVALIGLIAPFKNYSWKGRVVG